MSTIYQKYLDGDTLTDNEVLLGIQQAREVWEEEYTLGAIFMQKTLEDIAKARGLL